MTRKLASAATSTAAAPAKVDKQKAIGEPTNAMLAAAEGVMRSGKFSGLDLIGPTLDAMVSAPGALDHSKLTNTAAAHGVSIRNGQSNVEIARSWYAALCQAA